MEQDSSQIIFAIIFGAILMLLMSGFIVVMVLFHRQRQIKNRQKIDRLTAEYEKTVLSVEKEIREQTLVHVGQELHDNIGQILSLTKLTLRHSDPQRISEAKELVQQAIKEVRSLSKAINLNWAKDIDLKAFIAKELEKIAALDFCKTEFVATDKHFPLEESKKLVLMRMIQECLNNAIKHASPTLISIEIDQSPEKLFISIRDNGLGFDMDKDSDGQGLRNLQTRMNTIGGHIEVKSALGKGTEIQLLLPN
ncbi:MAG TPA: ATP-binding protein [Cyclobacteriaceae bacterium]|nr:ATP-binding protein [Cyclobacteriaceae bacterium]